MVEPPSTIFQCVMSFHAARAIPSKSMPPCCQKRRSSIATVALFTHGLTLENSTGCRLRSAGMEPSNEPSAA